VTTTVPERDAPQQKVKPFIVDSDVHPFSPDEDTLLGYVTGDWKERLRGRKFSIGGLGFGGGGSHPGDHLKRDQVPPSGGPPGSDPEFMRDVLLDTWGIGAALLTPFPIQLNAWWDADEAAELASAYNRYFQERWLAVDHRYKLNLVVSPLDPEVAAKEIRTVAAWDGICGVYLPLPNVLMGDRFYYPIYKAAEEHSLPIVFHGNGTDGLYQGAPTFGGGRPSCYSDFYLSFPHMVQPHVVNLIFSGTFERFPGLKIAFLEAGWGYMPHLLWRMDGAWKGLRWERPWVKKWPSEYVRQHMRFSTQPAYEAPTVEMLDQLLLMTHPESMIMFSTDYPHWDGDDPQVVYRQFGRLPGDLRDRIFSGNALETFSRL